ncbi:MAG: hypothetical protein K2L51_07280 [Clostridiales bacterium]|nr:hypothetical protein [Clostridiales bacterium]
MDNKVTKKRINDHLEYDWYKYLFILVACIVLFYFVFSQINRTRDYEDVNFFISCYDASENGFSDRVKSEMRSDGYRQNYKSVFGENVLRTISFETQNPLDSTYFTMLTTHGEITSDILIVGKSVLENTGAGYLELTDELLTEYLLPKGLKKPDGTVYDLGKDDLTYYTHENEEYGVSRRVGIKVSDFARLPFVTDWHKISSYAEKYKDETDPENLPDTEFYLVINRSSANIGKFGKKSKDKNAQALYCVNRFIAYYRA